MLIQGDYPGAFKGALVGGAGFGLDVDVQGCIHVLPDPDNPKDPTGNPLQPVSDGDLSEIPIIDNEFTDMGGNGIATIRLMSARMGLIGVVDCQIEQNRIRGCLQVQPTVPQQTLANVTAAFGGVILAGVERLTLRNNRIRENGSSFIVPTCGVFIQVGSGVVIEGNQIEDNGPLVRTAAQPTAGARAGSYLNMVDRPLVPDGAATILTLQFEGGVPAARITDNVVIAPMGPALFAQVLGTIMAEANHFTSHAADPTVVAQGLFAQAGTTVWITNLGKGIGFASRKIDFTNFGQMYNAATGAAPSLPWSDGLILCNQNQILFAPRTVQQTWMFASLFIHSSDDVSLEGNQSQCVSEILAVLTHAYVISTLSTRTADNRFAEQANAAALSAVTIALMNCTTDNQGTYSFLIAGAPSLNVRQPDSNFVDLTSPGQCAAFAKSMNQYFVSAGLSTV